MKPFAQSGCGRTRVAVLVFLFVIAVIPVSAAERPRTGRATGVRAPRKIRVLFIGNSYTYFNNLPELVSELSSSDPKSPQLETQMIVRGGATLRQHWEEGKALGRIKGSHWDFVVLQDQSMLPITDPEMTKQYARLFDSAIKKAGARTVFFLTWAHQDKPETQAELNETYQSIARELRALIAPVGIAWSRALKENPRLLLYMMDKSHPNAAGSYIAACVFYSTLVGRAPEGLTCRLSGNPVSISGAVAPDRVELVNLDADECRMLQRVSSDSAGMKRE